MKNKKITAEEQDMGKLGKLCSERKACNKNGWQHYVYQAEEYALHGTCVWASGIDLCWCLDNCAPGKLPPS